MDTLVAFAIALAVTLYFVRRYLRVMAPAGQAANGKTSAPAAAGGGQCPRCGKEVAENVAFCGACGAPLELWKVHRASVSAAGSEDTESSGKPRPRINASLCIGCGTCIDECPETGALALVNGKAILAEPEKCLGHAKCVDACPTSAIGLGHGNIVQTLSVPLVNESFETNVPGIFIVGELGGMGLIKTAINEGRLVIDRIQKRLTSSGWTPAASGVLEPPDLGLRPTTPADVIIVGSGPAGLSASLTATQRGIRYLVFDQAEVASTIRNYPRHKFLMAEPVEMPLYGSLYIADGTKESLVSVWENIVANTGVRVRTNERVDGVRNESGVFAVDTVKGRYFSRYVVLAMGKRGTPRRLDVPGEDLGKVAYRLIEAESYSGKDILVVGGGDSAVEAALALSRSRRNRVTLSYRKSDFSRARQRNQDALVSAEKEGLLRISRSSTISEIGAGNVRLSAQAEDIDIPNDYVFVLIGGEPPEGFLRKTGIEIVQKAISA